MFNPILGILASSGAVAGGSYESIATATVGSGGAAYVDFDLSSVSGYKHLQIRGSYTNAGLTNLYMTLNGSVTSTYCHYMFGDGTGGGGTAGSTTSNLFTIQFGNASTTLYGSVTDILDYTSTTKNKTIRTLGGADYNGSGGLFLTSNLYSTTSAITSIRIGGVSHNFAQYTQFSIYGIKD